MKDESGLEEGGRSSKAAACALSVRKGRSRGAYTSERKPQEDTSCGALGLRDAILCKRHDGIETKG